MVTQKLHFLETEFQQSNLFWIIFYQNFNIYIYIYTHTHTPKQELDEAVIKWRGSKTYNPGKLTKLGILVRKFSESESWIYMQP